MSTCQSGILAPLPPAARFLFLDVADAACVGAALARLATAVDGDAVVLGLGAGAVRAVGAELPGLEVFPALANGGARAPSTPHDLWLWLRGEDRGALLETGRQLTELLAPAFCLSVAVDGFVHAGGRDLTGYEDGTENPDGEDAAAAALVRGAGDGLDGGSFVAVQQWLHDMTGFHRLDAEAQDNIIGRHKADNEEFDEAPPSAHVKRSAQESFSPEAFMLRRSMPWVEGREAGLMFIAFGHSFAAFKAVLMRMMGFEDGIVDALFSISQPRSGAFFWCPPLRAGRPDLSRLGL